MNPHTPTSDRDPACPWLVRDHDTWRRGVLLTATADLLCGWRTALQSLHPRTRAVVARRYGRYGMPAMFVVHE